MSERIRSIVENINSDKEDSIGYALELIPQVKDITEGEKLEVTSALVSLFFHDYAGHTEMIKLAVRAEKQIGRFGTDVIPLLLAEITGADPEAAAHIGRAIAKNGAAAVGSVMGTIDANRDDDFAYLNLIDTLGRFNDPAVISGLPEAAVAAKHKNPKVRAAGLETLGRMVKNLGADLFDGTTRTKIFDVAFMALADTVSLVRMHAVRALGKMLKKGILGLDQKDKVQKAYNSILGNDSAHEWDDAYIVRHEAEQYIPLCKVGELSASDKYKQTFRILQKKELCPDTYWYEIEAPMVARRMQAGQFVIIRPNHYGERIPLSICGWDRDKGTINIIVMSAGRTSGEINAMNIGDCLADVVGPLGERSHVKKHEGTCVVIGGGYGTGAVLPTARDLKALGNRVIGIVGARARHLLLMVDELKEVCDEVMLTTNDGSVGIQGFVTHALEEILKRGEKVSHVLAVGPVPMMIAVSNMTKPLGIETYVSLNAIMVDGTGMCGACRVSVGGETKFACFHGPDFDGHKVNFDELMKRQKMFVEKEKEAVEYAKG